MRRSIRSTVSTSTTASSAGGQRCVRVILLSREEMTVFPESKSRVQDIFHQVCDHVGLREIEYFGLAQQIEGEYRFVDGSTKLQKLLPKGWKSKSAGEGQPAITLYLRVQHYVQHVSILREKVTRQQYYLQLKDNLLNHNQFVSEEKCFVLAGYALQADMGNRGRQPTDGSYFDPREYFPAWVIEERGTKYIKRHLPSMHADLCGMPRLEAMMHFIKDVSLPPNAHNLHFYKLKKRKMDPLGTAWLAICPKGVEIYEETNNFKSLLSTFAWPDIEKLHSEKKRFEVRVVGGGEHKFVYYANSEDHAKSLLAFCRSSHLFQMSLQPKLAEMRVLEAEDKRYRETYIYSENAEFSWNDSQDDHSVSSSQRSAPHPGPSAGRIMATPLQFSSSVPPPPAGDSRQSSQRNGNSQRVSVISSTSSNTTSGIVSDRMHASLEDSDDERNHEIMIDSPPAPSATSSYGSLWTSTPQSLHGLSPIATPGSVTRVSSTQHRPASRSNSNQSGQSVNLALPPPLPLDRTPVPVDAHVERITFATPMTVSSNPVGLSLSKPMSTPQYSTPLTASRGQNLNETAEDSCESNERVKLLLQHQQLQAELQRHQNELHLAQVQQTQLENQQLQAQLQQLQQQMQREKLFQLQHLQLQSPESPAGRLQRQHMQHLQQQLEAAQAAFQSGSPYPPPPASRSALQLSSELYDNFAPNQLRMQSLPPSAQRPLMPASFENSQPNAIYSSHSFDSLHQMGYSSDGSTVSAPAVPLSHPQPPQHRNHTYENIPPIQMAINAPTPEVARLRGGTSLPGSALGSLSSLSNMPVRGVLADMRRRSCTVAATPGSPFPVSHAVTVTRAKSAVQTSTPKPVDVRAKQLMVPATPKVTETPKPSENGLPSEDVVDGPAKSLAPKSSPQSCPVHGGSHSNVVKEIRGLSGGTNKVPLLTALCNDDSLMSSACTCSRSPLPASASKRFSLSQPPNTNHLMQPGTLTRPVSWHSDNMTLEQMQSLEATNAMSQSYQVLSNGRIPQKISAGGRYADNSNSLLAQTANLGLA